MGRPRLRVWAPGVIAYPKGTKHTLLATTWPSMRRTSSQVKGGERALAHLGWKGMPDRAGDDGGPGKPRRMGQIYKLAQRSLAKEAPPGMSRPRAPGGGLLRSRRVVLRHREDETTAQGANELHAGCETTALKVPRAAL